MGSGVWVWVWSGEVLCALSRVRWKNPTRKKAQLMAARAGDLNIEQFLDDVCHLPQYKSAFKKEGVDGEMLLSL